MKVALAIVKDKRYGNYDVWVDGESIHDAINLDTVAPTIIDVLRRPVRQWHMYMLLQRERNDGGHSVIQLHSKKNGGDNDGGGNPLKYVGVLPKDDVLETLLTYLPML